MDKSSIFYKEAEKNLKDHKVKTMVENILSILLNIRLSENINIVIKELQNNNTSTAVLASFDFDGYDKEGNTLINPVIVVGLHESPQDSVVFAQKELLVTDRNVSPVVKDFIFSLVGSIARYQYHSILAKYKLSEASEAFQTVVDDRMSSGDYYQELSVVNSEATFALTYQVANYNKLLNWLPTKAVDFLEKELN